MIMNQRFLLLNFSNAASKLKLIYKFFPSQKLVHLSGYFLHSFKHHIWGWSTSQKYARNPLVPSGPFFWLLAVRFWCHLLIEMFTELSHFIFFQNLIWGRGVNFPKIWLLAVLFWCHPLIEMFTKLSHFIFFQNHVNNFPKICTKSSSPQLYFFWLLAKLFCLIYYSFLQMSS